MSHEPRRYSNNDQDLADTLDSAELLPRLVSNKGTVWLALALGVVVSATLSWFFLASNSYRFNDSADVDADRQAIEHTLARTSRESRSGVEPPKIEAPPNSELFSGEKRKASSSKSNSPVPPRGFQFVSHRGKMTRAPLAKSFPVEPSPNPSWLDPNIALERLLRNAEHSNRDWTFAAVRLAMPEIPVRKLVQSLASLGVRLEGISGEYARVRIPADRNILLAVSDLPQVRGLGAIPEELKVASEFLHQASEKPAGELVPVFVTLMMDDLSGEWRSLLTDMGVTVGAYDPDLRSYTANLPYSVLRSLVQADFVMAVERVAVVHAELDTATAAMAVDALRNYDYSTSQFTGVTGDGIAVGALDTGLSTRHVDIFSGRSGICGVNMVDGERTDLWVDRNGHGTFVMGTFVGAGQDRPELAGMAPNVSHIRFAKVLNIVARGTSEDVRRGMSFMAGPSSCFWGGRTSASVKPLIVNMSLGTDGIAFSGRGVEERKLDSVVYGSDQLYVVAQANAGALAFSNYGTAKNSLAVGAVDDAGIIADFSSHGPTGDGRLAPNLVGTGVDITSAAGESRPNGYRTLSGTSFSSPSVAGVAALLMEAEPDFREQPALARARLMASAVRPDAFLKGSGSFARDNTNGPGTLQNQYGLGLVSARTSILSRDTEDGWVLGSATSEPAGGNYEYLDIEVPEGASRLDIVMTWDEQPTDTLTSSVINNLDLLVDEGADCTDEPCGEHASRSVRDNVEWLFIDNPTPGTHRVKVVPKRLYGEEVKAAIAWTLIRGEATPQLNVQVDRESVVAEADDEFDITVTVSVDQYLSSGTTLHLSCRYGQGSCGAIGSDLRGSESHVLRKDGIARSLPSRRYIHLELIPLGEIAAGEGRQVRLKFAPASWVRGSELLFTASSWNARSAIASSVPHIGDPDVVPAGTSSSQGAEDASSAVRITPPSNDDFANAIELTGLEDSDQLDLLPASREPGEPGVQGNSRTAWYTWTAPREGLFRFRVKNAELEVAEEADIDLYTGEYLASLNPVESKRGSELTLVVERGQAYKLRIGTTAWRQQELILQLEPADLRPSNDDFAFAQQISSDEGEVEGSNEGATLEGSEFWAGLAATVWYEWTAPSDGYWHFTTDVSERRVLAFTGNRLSDLRFVADPQLSSRTIFPAGEGEVYRIAVASIDADASGSPFKLNWLKYGESSPSSYADNDRFTGAEELQGAEGEVVQTGGGLTVEPLEPLVTGIGTAWWRWRAPEDGTYTWRYQDPRVNEGNTYTSRSADLAAMRLNVFTGQTMETLSLVTSVSGHAPVTFDATEGTTYHLALGRLPYAIDGSARLPDFNWGKSPQNDHRDQAVEVFGPRGSVSGSVLYATAEPDEPPDTWGGESAWWRWSAPSSGWYRFWVEDNPVSVILSLYPRNQVGAVSTRASASSERTFLASGRAEAHLLARAGDVYEIRLSHRSQRPRIQSFKFFWEPTGPPVSLRYVGAANNEVVGGSPPALHNPLHVAIHPAGRHLFATSDRRLLGFTRDPTTGDLSLGHRFDAGTAPDSDVQFAYLSDPRLYWDFNRERLYSLSLHSHSFQFNPDQARFVSPERVTLNGAIYTRNAKVSAHPAGDILYLLGYRAGPLQLVRIDSEREFTLVQTIRGNSASGKEGMLVSSMKDPRDVAVSLDGSHVYVLAEEALNVFSSDPATDRLSLVRSIPGGPQAPDGPFAEMGRLQNLAVDSSGRYLFVTGTLPARVAVFDLSVDSSNPKFLQSVVGLFRFGSDPNFPYFVTQTLIPAGLFRNCEFAKPHGNRTAIDVLCQYGFYSALWDPTSEELRITDFANSGTVDRYGELFPTLSSQWRQFVESPDGRHLYVTTSQFNDLLPNAIQIFERASAMTVDDGSNHRPSVNQALADQEATVGQAFSYQFSEATFADADGDSLSFTAEGMPAWLSFNAQTRTFSGTPGEDDVTLSPIVITVMAIDGVGATASAGFGLSVPAQESARNSPPVASRALDDQSARADQAFTYQFSANSFTDPDGDSLTYSATGLPAWLRFTPATRTFSGTPTAADVTTAALLITVTATDPEDASGRSSFQLTVLAASDTEDSSPAFPSTSGPGNQTYTVGTAISTLALPTATGGNGTLTYSLSPAVPGLSFDTTTRQLTGTPTTAGTHAMTYTVTDADGDSDSLSFTITVQDSGGEMEGDLGDCYVGLLVHPGQSCTYPGTDADFSVGADGRGMFLIITSARAININQVTYQGTYYDFRAQHEGDGIWRIDRLDGSTTP